MELVNTGRRVRNPLQHKGFRRFQNCRHRPQQTRKYQVRTRLEIVLSLTGHVGSNPTISANKRHQLRLVPFLRLDGADENRAAVRRPQAISPVQRRRPLPVAETGRSCWGSVLIFQSPAKGLRKNQQTQPVAVA